MSIVNSNDKMQCGMNLYSYSVVMVVNDDVIDKNVTKFGFSMT